MSPFTLLDHLRLITIVGPDRATFLQGQLTQDVLLARTDSTLLAGWADARGRLHFAGHLFALGSGEDQALALLVPAERAPALTSRLKLYTFRSRVQVTVADVPLLGMATGGVTPTGSQVLALAGDPSRQLIVGDGTGRTLPAGPFAASPDWELADIRAGIPTIHAATSGEFVPQMANLDLLGGISFTKGCYTGQEIVARMKYLGRVKRRMLHFSAAGAMPAPGDALYAARGAAGQVVRSAPSAEGSEFLAVVVLDDLPGPFWLDPEQSRAVRRLELPYAIPG